LHARKFVMAVAVAMTLLMAAPAVAFAAWGAIAANGHTLVWGKSWGYSTKFGAEQRALAECRSAPHGDGGCQGVIVYKNECGAVFENRARTKFFFAFGFSKRSAKRKVRRAHPTAIFLTAGCATHG